MVLTEILLEARSLPRADQVTLIRELAAELRRTQSDEGEILPGGEYEVWSPHSAYEAADVLMRCLGAANESGR